MIKKGDRDKIKSEKYPGSPSEAKIYIDKAPFELIRFDRKAKIYIGICLFLFVFFVVFKLHNSSIPLWNTFLNDGDGDKKGLVVGKPLTIRSDEWMIVSSFIVAQEKDTFPVTNRSLGYGKTPLVMGLPTRHILSTMKPALWGYYFLDKERAFSWQWNFKIFPFLIASFLFLMLFTKNNFIVSSFGSIWLFLSSAIQWWSINTEIFTFGLSSIISLIYILYSNKTKLILLNGIIFLLFSYSFIMILYPAYQVPVGYFLFALLLSFIISRQNLRVVLEKRMIKLAGLALIIAILSLLVYTFFQECKDTIKILTSTVYPGQRTSTGGDFPFISLFRDNYTWFLNETYFPPKWGNICELSSFLMLSPVPALLMIYTYFTTKKINPLFIPLLIFQIVIYIWLFAGFPEFLAKLTLFSSSPANRTAFVFGFSNVIFTLLYVAQFRDTVVRASPFQNKLIAFIIIFGIVFTINYLLNKQADGFFSIAQIFNATIVFSILTWLLVFFQERKIFKSLFFSGCLFFLASNVFINPLSRGLAPYFENKIYNTVTEINDKDPDATWVVYGHPAAANFLKSAGVNCFNGVQFIPQLEKLHILDPLLQNNAVYNRYANIMFSPLIDAKDSIKFVLNGSDLYTIQADPCSPHLKELGIKYFMFSYRPTDPEVRCMQPVKDTLGFFIYKRNDL